MKPRKSPLKHGKRTTYVDYGCRCDACRQANTEGQTRYGHGERLRAARLAERVEIDGRLVHPDPYGGHGSTTAYNACGCRCDPCRAAANEYQRTYRARHRGL